MTEKALVDFVHMQPTLGINSTACDVSEPGCLVCVCLTFSGEHRVAEDTVTNPGSRRNG